MSNSTLSDLPSGHWPDSDCMSDQCIHQIYNNESKKSIRGWRGKRNRRQGRERREGPGRMKE